MENKGRVYLVGAGCGEADLITVRGQRLISSCEVLVYDDLIAPQLLQLAPADAEKIYMGKRSGKHAAPQQDINHTLLAKALEGKRVVRLKGGDPFVFGRGGEEAEALKQAGVEYEVVPGISSSIAIPAAAGIPVTHRGLSRSFHVITAHTADTEDGLPEYMEKLAQLPGTLVFLMGLSRLEKIVQRLMDGGMSPETPAAVISGGNSPNPAVVRSELSRIGEETRKVGVRSPAVILVGATAAMDLSATLPRPLSGKSIALTGTDAISSKLQPMLEELGANCFTAQRSLVCPLSFELDMEKLEGETCTLVFTSSNGVDTFFDWFRRNNGDLRRLYKCRFAVIGEATGATLRNYGIVADIVPSKFTSRELALTINRTIPPQEPVYLLRSAGGSQELKTILEQEHPLKDIHTYSILSDESLAEENRENMEKANYVCFSSASGVRAFMNLYGKISEKTNVVCIGEICATEFEKFDGRDYLMAEEISAEGMVRTIVSHSQRKKSS